MGNSSEQGELFALIWKSPEQSFRLRPRDLIRIDGRLALVIRVNECAAVVVMNRPMREFKTRFDKPVRFQPPPLMFRISSDSELEILNRTKTKPNKPKRKERKSA